MSRTDEWDGERSKAGRPGWMLDRATPKQRTKRQLIMTTTCEPWLVSLRRGLVLPACPLALNRRRKLDERRQLGLIRYYFAAGAGGLAVGVHTTQFEIRSPEFALFHEITRLAAVEMKRLDPARVRIGGICGATRQAVAEAEWLRECGYHAGLLSLAALREATDVELIRHCKTIGSIIPIVGFYLQPAVGGRRLGKGFWKRFVELGDVVAIKVAPFNRYQTLDVLRAVAESGREDIALYTGNDDNIVADLLTPYRFEINGLTRELRFVGGLLGHWAVWTRRAVELHAKCTGASLRRRQPAPELLRIGAQVTDMNAALFDAANGFAGCIAGIHEVLRRQGLLEGIWCLNPRERLSPGQAAELTRISREHPELTDDDFVAENLAGWLAG